MSDKENDRLVDMIRERGKVLKDKQKQERQDVIGVDLLEFWVNKEMAELMKPGQTFSITNPEMWKGCKYMLQKLQKDFNLKNNTGDKP
jgi:hypothetical protein